MGERLRAILGADDVALAGGAHDAMTARLVEQTGFDAVWASSFGISLAGHCLPDADLLTMTETLQVMGAMARACGIPVLADCNAGFGNAINVMRLVEQAEGVGLAGVCIEDNPFPKRCSLYDGWDRELVTPAEMAAKVRAAVQSRSDGSFVIVARVESLIAREGVDAALDRASQYVDAGADALLVHAREFASLRDFTQRWDGRRPLIVVPTLFPEVTLGDLAQAGFAMAIFPNQAVRAAVTAITTTLESIRRTGEALTVNATIAPLEEVYRLVELETLRDADRCFATPG